VQISYIKSSFSPVAHADGVFGGPTPHGLLYIGFFSEHPKLPDTVQYAVDAAAKTLMPVSQPNRKAEWVREIEEEVIMSVELARSFRDWLDDKIKLIEQRRPEDALRSIEEQQS
jgi:hypothetical protein